MQKPYTAAARTPARGIDVRRAMGGFVLRRFDPACDSYEPITVMLHRAFARLGMMGLNCTCVDQSAAVTQQRALAGDCFVAVYNGTVVGTMTLCAPDTASSCELYRCGDVASVRQLAIDPAWQARGIGKSMLTLAEHWAATRGYAQLALDTPRPAAHLIAFYRGQGFRVVDELRFDGKHYDSAILSKAPVALRTLAAWSRTLELPQRVNARAA